MTLIMQNKPNFPKHQNISNLSSDKGLRKSPTFRPPKQTQFTECQIKRNLSPNKGLRKQTPLYEKRNTNYAKQTQFAGCSNELNLSLSKGLRKYVTLRTPPKQTQSNPIEPNQTQPVVSLSNLFQNRFLRLPAGPDILTLLLPLFLAQK